MKIALVSDVPESLPLSGPQRVTKGLAEALMERGHDVVVVNYRGDEELIDCPVVVLPNDVQSFNLSMIKFQRDALRWLADQDIDIIHWWGAYLPHPDIGASADVLSLHGVGVESQLSSDWKVKMASTLNALQKTIGSWTTETVVQSSKTQADAESFGVRVNDVIAVGIENRFLQHNQKGGKRVLYVSRINEKKNQRELVEAAKTEDWNLRLAGRAASREYMEDIPELEEYYIDSLSEQALLDEYAKADVYVLPSIHEGFGLTGLEAMASGTPLVAANTTGICDIIKNGVNGYVYKQGNIPDLREKTNKALAETEVLSAGAKQTAQELQWKNVAKRYIVKYQEK